MYLGNKKDIWHFNRNCLYMMSPNKEWGQGFSEDFTKALILSVMKIKNILNCVMLLMDNS